MERFNNTPVKRLNNYVAENQKGWDRLLEPLKHAYNHQVHLTKDKTPFALVLSRHPPSVHLANLPSAKISYLANKNLKIAEFKKYALRKVAESLQKSKKLEDTQRRYKAEFDKELRSPLRLEVGDWV